MPARTSLMTGVYATQHGCLVNDGVEGYCPARGDLPIPFSRSLKAAGYTLGHVGKWGSARTLRWLRWASTSRAGIRLPCLAWRRVCHPVARHTWFGEVDPGHHTGAERAGLGRRPRHPPVAEAVERNRPSSSAGIRRSRTCRPSHPEPFASLVGLEDVPPWSSPRPAGGQTWRSSASRCVRGTSPAGAGTSGAGRGGAISASLHSSTIRSGASRLALDDLGLVEQTLVVYTSDHGDPCGGHGMIDKHYVMYDDVARAADPALAGPAARRQPRGCVRHPAGPGDDLLWVPALTCRPPFRGTTWWPWPTAGRYCAIGSLAATTVRSSALQPAYGAARLEVHLERNRRGRTLLFGGGCGRVIIAPPAACAEVLHAPTIPGVDGGDE